jgi:tetratricopeptide (TPR) repeat protein
MNRFWTHFRYFPALVVLGLLICLCSAKTHPGTPQDPAALKAEAWEAWENGEIEQAGRLARELIRTRSVASSGYHLLFLKDFLEGNYEEALQIYKEIDSEYAKYGELDETLINTYIYLGRYAEAEQFASSRNMEEHTIARLRQLNEHLLKVKLDTLSVIPFARVFPRF